MSLQKLDGRVRLDEFQTLIYGRRISHIAVLFYFAQGRRTGVCRVDLFFFFYNGSCVQV